MALRRPLVNSSLTWQTQAAPSLRNLGPRIRQFHPSPFPRRAPVPNPPPRPTTSTLGTTNGVSGSSTLGSGAGNGGRPNGSGSGGKRPSPHAMWYREIVPGEFESQSEFSLPSTTLLPFSRESIFRYILRGESGQMDL